MRYVLDPTFNSKLRVFASFRTYYHWQSSPLNESMQSSMKPEDAEYLNVSLDPLCPSTKL